MIPQNSSFQFFLMAARPASLKWTQNHVVAKPVGWLLEIRLEVGKMWVKSPYLYITHFTNAKRYLMIYSVSQRVNLAHLCYQVQAMRWCRQEALFVSVIKQMVGCYTWRKSGSCRQNRSWKVSESVQGKVPRVTHFEQKAHYWKNKIKAEDERRRNA